MEDKSNKRMDDLEAVRLIVDTLSKFQKDEQERVLRWVNEKLGFSANSTHTSNKPIQTTVMQETALSANKHNDIRTFYQEKKPQSDNQFAAVVAYYYQFEAPDNEKKQTITAKDLENACRTAGYKRMPRPIQTLINAHQVGLLDKPRAGEFSVNSVGENLVALTLPNAVSGTPAVGKRRKGKVRKKHKKK